MDTQSILVELRDQKDRLDRAIDALENTSASKQSRGGRKPGRRHMSADARRRIGLAMKLRWAARKRKEKKAA